MSDAKQTAEDIFGELKDEMIRIWGMVRIYETVYQTSKADIKLMNEFAPGFFGHMQQIFLDFLALDISKLLDPSSSSGHPNLSLEKFVQRAELNNGQCVELEEKLADARDLAENIIHVRKKRIAHNDFAVHWDKQQDLAFNFGEIRETLKAIGDFLNYFQHNVLDEGRTGYSETGATQQGIGMLEALRMAEDYCQLSNEGVIPKSRQLAVRNRDESYLEFSEVFDRVNDED